MRRTLFCTVLAVTAALLAASSAYATPTPRFTISPNPAVTKQTVTFDARTSTCDRSPCTYTWSESGGSLGADGAKTGSLVTTYYNNAGTKRPQLRVRNSIGQSATLTKTLTVNTAPAPTPTPSPTPTPTPPPLAQCDDGVDNDGDGKIDFDGGNGEGNSPDPGCSSLSDNSESPDPTPTPSPTPVPTPSPTPTPTPEPPPTGGNNCMPNPSACGYPDVETVGVDPLVPRQAVSGTVTLSTAGMVYENKTVTGGIVVTAPNVTIRNVKIINTEPWYSISSKAGTSWNAPNSNLTVDHVEIDAQGYMEIKGIAFDGYTLKNSYFHDGADCAHFGVNVTIENNLCVDGPDANNDAWPDAGFGCADGPHYDGFQSDGGNNIRIVHNTIRIPCSQTSAILMSTNTSPIGNVTVTDNLMAGGGYTLYCDAGNNLYGTNSFLRQRFARTYFPQSGYWGPTTGCESYPFSGVWDDTGAAL